MEAAAGPRKRRAGTASARLPFRDRRKGFPARTPVPPPLPAIIPPARGRRIMP